MASSHRQSTHESHRPRYERRDEPLNRTPGLPPLPDLRFEATYVKSVKPYVHLDLPRTPHHESDEKTLSISNGERLEVVRVDWGNVLWITLRDQVLSPFAQGAIWYVPALRHMRMRNANLG